jgi:hypothetical protein
MEHEEKHEECEEHRLIAVAVITPSGTYPDDYDYRRSTGTEIVGHILEKAAAHLHLTNTSDWDAFVDNRQIDPNKTFAENHLHGIIEIEWHKREGGGGA